MSSYFCAIAKIPPYRTTTVWGGTVDRVWTNLIGTYIGESAYFATHLDGGNSGFNNAWKTNTLLECPSMAPGGFKTAYYPHYGINRYTAGGLGNGTYKGWLSMSNIKKSSAQLLIMDSVDNTTYNKGSASGTYDGGLGSYVTREWGMRHSKLGSNVLFFDGHVKLMTRMEMILPATTTWQKSILWGWGY